MVRLKAPSTFLLLVTNLISIPYGAIKRVESNEVKESEEAFQFLMVRLKVALLF